ASENQVVAGSVRTSALVPLGNRLRTAVLLKVRCKPGAKHGPDWNRSSHSKRRISTGRSRAAALAGASVARSEIPIATTEIHTPSIALGWNGTKGTAYTCGS